MWILLIILTLAIGIGLAKIGYAAHNAPEKVLNTKYFLNTIKAEDGDVLMAASFEFKIELPQKAKGAFLSPVIIDK